MALLEPGTEAILHDISSLTVSSVTITALQQALGISTSGIATDRNAKSKGSSRAPTVSTKALSKPSATSKSSKTNAQIVVHTEQRQVLSKHERLVLATKVINTGIKAVSSVAKQSNLQCTSIQAGPKPTSTTQPRTRPLTNRSPNSPGKRANSQKHVAIKVRSGGQPSGVSLLAECTRIALCYVRTNGKQPCTGTLDIALENGSLSFIGKCLALDLDTVALKELRMMKARFDRISRSASAEQKDVRKGAAETLGALLDTTLTTGYDNNTFASWTKYQIYVARVILRSLNHSDIEYLLQHLDIDHANSPLNIMLRQAKSAKDSLDDIKQLGAFINGLLAGCPSVVADADTKACDRLASVTPASTFRIHTIVWHYRAMIAALDGRQFHFEKDYWRPLAKCLMAFARRASMSATEKYALAKRSYILLDNTYKSAPNSFNNSSPSNDAASQLLLQLSTMAQGASAFEDAIMWTSKCQSASTAEVNGSAQAAIGLLRLATLALQPESSLDPLQHMPQAHSSMITFLKGDSNELDMLLLEVAGYRKVLMTRILSDSKNASSVLAFCYSGIFACARFLLRYVGKPLDANLNCKLITRQAEKRERAGKVAPGITDSVFHCCKDIIKSSNLVWQEIDTALDDCIQLVCSLAPFDDQTRYCRSKVASKASTLYLAVYRQAMNIPKERLDLGLQALKRSISVLSNEDPDTREAGQYVQKLEQLMHHYQSLQDFDRAYTCVDQVMQHFADQGYLDQLANMSATSTYDGLWQSENGLVIGRVLDDLDNLLNRALRCQHRTLTFYGVEQPPEIKGLLLERQLRRFSESLLRPGGLRDHKQIELVSHALSTLLDIYDYQSFPIRRQRIVAIGYKLSALLAPQFDDKFGGRIVHNEPNELNVASSKDSGLTGFHQHWCYINQLGHAISQQDLAMPVLDQALDFWTQISKSRTSLDEHIDDISGLLDMLHVVSVLSYVKRENKVYFKTLSLLELLLNAQSQPDFDTIVNTTCKKASLCLELGQLGSCGSHIARAQSYSISTVLSNDTLLKRHLVQAQLYLVQGIQIKCQEALLAAALLADADIALAKAGQSTRGSATRTNMWLAQGFEIAARLKMDQGDAAGALGDAKCCVKLLQRTWASLENDKLELRNSNDNDSSSQNDVKPPLDQSGVVTKSLTHEALKGVKFWNLIPSLIDSYQLLSSIYRHHAMFAESLYWLDSAQKICDAIPAASSQSLNLNLLAELHFEDGQTEKGQELLDSAAKGLEQAQVGLKMVRYHQAVARTWQIKDDPDKELQACEAGLQALAAVNDASQSMVLPAAKALNDDLVTNFAKMRIGEETPIVQATRASRTKAKPVAALTKPKQAVRKAGAKGAMTDLSSRSIEGQSDRLGAADLILDKAAALLRKRDLASAAEALDHVQSSIDDGRIQHRKAILAARLNIANLLRMIVSDCTFAMLPESTISIPAVKADELSQDCVDMVTANAVVHGTTKSAKQNTSRKLTKAKSTRKPQTSAAELCTNLCKTRDDLLKMQALVSRSSSVAEYGKLCSLLSIVSAYVSAAMQSTAPAYVHPSSVAMSIDQPNIFAQQRTLAASLAGDRSIGREDMYVWPSVALLHDTRHDESSQTSPAQFQTLYVDILPRPWTAISLQLSETKEDLLIARYRRDEAPFVLRVPISPQSHDPMEDAFSYDDGKGELLSIIAESFDSTHNSKYVESKEAKTEWWALRESLDTRIQELLMNIEKIWFGGFRGILSPQRKQPLLLAKLEKAILISFDRHLPSRQSKQQHKAIKLDMRVWEMFIGLGDPRDDSVDIDESLADLLYFIVDILQFNGETNAYDEVDFDAVVIDCLDALKAYYAASTTTDNDSDEHMILILDKDLHMFPWESLPCLIGKNVSRLPSLEDLRLRILAMRSSSPSTANRAGHHVTKTTGSSLLNPSGDLAGTETVMQPLLLNLSGSWTHSTAAPTDKELAATLSRSSLFLYFGHGSGNQFITNRAVRTLQSCPTTWLMGCSSATLKCHGTSFQPSGMVLSYLAAGAPAVVGTLWDVTDKDCDRASVKMGESWGLWQTKGQHKLLALKGRQKGVETEKARGVRGKLGGRTQLGRHRSGSSAATENALPSSKGAHLSLVEAVRLGREECYLRYLNGAALVVYGIPVYLDS